LSADAASAIEVRMSRSRTGNVPLVLVRPDEGIDGVVPPRDNAGSRSSSTVRSLRAAVLSGRRTRQVERSAHDVAMAGKHL